MSQETPNPGTSGAPQTPGPHEASGPVRPGQSSSYPEIAPGVPRYGQYAPEQSQQPANPSHPTHPAPFQPGLPAPQPDMPQQVRLASILIMIAGAIQLVFGAVSAVALFSLSPAELRQNILSATAGFPDSAVVIDDNFLRTILVVSVLLQFLIVACYFWIAVKIQAGRNWARVTGTVLAALSVLMIFNPLNLLPVGLGVVAMVYCWLPKNRAYFTTSTRR